MLSGQIVHVPGIHTFVEVCDAINDSRFTGYWLVATPLCNNYRLALDFYWERAMSKIDGKPVLHLYQCECEVVGERVNGVIQFENEYLDVVEMLDLKPIEFGD